MADVVSPEVRSRMMAGIRGKNTKPELFIRSGLHRMGFRFRIHAKNLPGRPDIVLAKWNAVIFVHGCFWHGHDCHLFRVPATRQKWWREKFNRNRLLDRRAVRASQRLGWRVMSVYECALKGRERLPPEQLLESIAKWLRSKAATMEVRGQSKAK